jgi:hypothetical protein
MCLATFFFERWDPLCRDPPVKWGSRLLHIPIEQFSRRKGDASGEGGGPTGLRTMVGMSTLIFFSVNFFFPATMLFSSGRLSVWLLEQM